MIFHQVTLTLLSVFFLCFSNALYADESFERMVRLGKIEQIRKSLENGTLSPHHTSSDEKTMLMLAAEEGHIEIVRLLLDKGTKINVRDKGGATALTYAAYENKSGVVKLLLERGADPNLPGSHGRTALFFAACKGYVDIVKDLIAKGANVNARDEKGISILGCKHRANDRNPEVVRLLLSQGAVPHSGLILWAAENGYLDIIQTLIAKGIDVNYASKKKDGGGYTALMAASKNAHYEVAKELLARKADINARDDQGYTALQYAVENRRNPVALLLIDAGADVNVQNAQGYTVLMNAAEKGNAELVEKLIAKGADVNAQTGDGLTALDYARKSYQSAMAKVVQLLKQAGARETSSTNK